MGALSDTQLERYSRHILLKEIGIKGRSRMTKGQLVDALRNH